MDVIDQANRQIAITEARAILIQLGWVSPESTDDEVVGRVMVATEEIVHKLEPVLEALVGAYEQHGAPCGPGADGLFRMLRHESGL